MSARLVIGTAGHIDHGKTSLVRALTGMDTDRLAEEKRRGISIDLGFASLLLPGGERLSFIDVPGHERFIRNMLAGAAGIEAVLLVIAADESVKPQTREHFDICRLLDIRRGLIVLTKADLATPAQIEQTRRDARQLTQGSFLADAPMIPVSSITGVGLDELKAQLARLAGEMTAAETTRRDSSGLPRLPIDRSFALKGFGTVATGTLWSGALHVGDTVRIHPINAEARIRGLQRHGQPVETAVAGDRTAVNLSGIEHAKIKRGYTLTSLSELEATTTIDVSLEWLSSFSAPTKPAEFLLALGTAEAPVTLKPLRERFGRLCLSEPLLALPGDRFVLRRPSPAMTVAGGTVIDPFPPRRINRAKTYERLSKLAAASAAQRIEILIDESPNGLSIKQLIRLTGISSPPRTSNLTLVNGQHIVSDRWLEQRREKLVEWLKAFHAKNPAASGAAIAQARLGLDAILLSAVLSNFTAVTVRGELISLAAHRPQTSAADAQALAEIELAFRQAGFMPPAPGEFSRPLLESLVKSGTLVRISADLIFHAEVVSHIRQSLAAHKGRRFTVPDFKSWTNISRKYAIPLLEYLDQQHVTKRDGDGRVVL
jgi:selenocysteine-specific elongation factor